MCATPASDRVLHTAIDLFYRHGIRAVGIDTVVADSGVAKMTLYKHYPSKDALVTAALEAQDRAWRAWFEAELARVDGGPEARLLGMFDLLGSTFSSGDYRGCAFINAAVELREPAHPGLEVARAHKRWLRDLIREAVEAADLREPEIVTAALFLLLEGAVVGAQVGVAGDPAGTAKRTARLVIGAHRKTGDRNHAEAQAAAT